MSEGKIDLLSEAIAIITEYEDSSGDECPFCDCDHHDVHTHSTNCRILKFRIACRAPRPVPTYAWVVKGSDGFLYLGTIRDTQREALALANSMKTQDGKRGGNAGFCVVRIEIRKEIK